MRERAGRDGRDALEGIGPEYLNLIQPADGHVGELTLASQREIHMIGDGPCIDLVQHIEGRTRVEDDHLADILQREPNLVSAWCGGDIGAERGGLRHATGDAPGAHLEDQRLGSEARAHVAITAVGRKDDHAGTIGHRNARNLTIALCVEH